MLLNGFAQFTASPALNGKSTDGVFTDKTPKPIEMLSFHHELKRDGWQRSDQDYLPFDATHGQVTILKPIDETTVDLAKATCLGTTFDKVELIKVDADKDKPIIEDLKVFTVPETMVYLNGEIIGRMEGPMTAEQACDYVAYTLDRAGA